MINLDYQFSVGSFQLKNQFPVLRLSSNQREYKSGPAMINLDYQFSVGSFQFTNQREYKSGSA